MDSEELHGVVVGKGYGIFFFVPHAYFWNKRGL